MKRLIAKKPTKKEIAQRKSEMADFLVDKSRETFAFIADMPQAAKMIKDDLDQYGWTVDELKTEDCDFIFKNVLKDCQDIYDAISDRFFDDYNPDNPDYIAVDDENSNTRSEIYSLINDYEKYTTKRLYQMVPDKLIENVRKLYK